MWFVGDMKVTTNCFLNCRNTCRGMKRQSDNLYKYLTENGDLERAMANSEKLCQLCKESPEDLKAYSEVHKVIKLLNDIKS